MRKIRGWWLVLAACSGLLHAGAMAGGQPAIGEASAGERSGAYLAASCTNCHGSNGVAQGAMPSLAGMESAFIAEQMRLFRDGLRPSTVMQQIAKGYSDAQINAMADYFSAQKP
ncbi:MAG TPA: c-type cytochrome [Burkholderiaceae bacterium]|nr:c-type cytochrome [Burkholderiaceae bacterium]